MPVISKGREWLFFLLFTIQLIIWVVLLSFDIPCGKVGWASKIVYVGRQMGLLMVLTTGLTVVAIEGIPIMWDTITKRTEKKLQRRLDAALDKLDGQVPDEVKQQLRDALKDKKAGEEE